MDTKREKIKLLLAELNIFRLFPHLMLLHLHPNRKIYELFVWLRNLSLQKFAPQYNTILNAKGLLYLLTYVPEYRNLFYYRLGSMAILIKWMCCPMNTLFISTKNIGAGLFIQHGFATIIAAKSIRKDCWIKIN